MRLLMLIGLLGTVACTIQVGPGQPDVGGSGSGGSSGSVDGPANGAGGNDGEEPVDAPRADGVVRDILYRQLTNAKVAAERPTGQPAISGNGKRIAFAIAHGTGEDTDPNRIYTVDSDGRNLKQVDAYKTGCYCGSEVAISDDGNTIVSSDATQVRVVDASGSLKGSFQLTSNEIHNVAISADGSKVFVLVRRDAALKSNGAPMPRGTYRMNADGTGLTRIVSPEMIAPLVGKTASDVFPLSGCGTSLAVSGDGSKVYTVTGVGGLGDTIVASSGSGGGASVVMGPNLEGNHYVFGVAVSKDGSKAAYWASSKSPAGGDVVVMGPDGSSKKKLFDDGGMAGCRAPFKLSSNGSKLALGWSTLVLPTNGSDPHPMLAATSGANGDPWQLGAPDDGNSAELVMSSDGKHFAYMNNDGVVGRQLGYAEIDPAAIPASIPHVTSPSITPSSLPRDDGQTKGTLQVSVAGSPYRVASVPFLQGLSDGNKVGAQNVLLGENGGDVYRFSHVTAQKTAQLGPRIIRVRAEARSSDGVRSAHAIDFGGLTIVD